MAILLENIAQLLITMGGVLAFFTLLLLLLQKLVIGFSQRYLGFKSIYPTAIIGVPLHEVSHALMAIVFRHNIRKINLFSPDAITGNLGSVELTCPNNMYSIVGNFFIAMAPLLGGSIALFLINYLLFPEINELLKPINFSGQTTATIQTSYLMLSSLFQYSFNDMAYTFLNFSFSIKHLLWLYLSCSVALHMAPSKKDFENSIVGLLAITFIAAIFLILFPEITTQAAKSIKALSISLARMLMFSFCLSLIAFIAIFIVAFFKDMFCSIRSIKC